MENRSPFRRGVSLAIALAFLWTAVVFPAAGPAFAASPTLAKAEDLYLKSQHDEVIRLIRDALSKGQLTGRDKVEARALVARALVRRNEKDAARAEFIEVLELEPFWVPDELVVPPDEVEVFQAAREEFKKRPARPEQRAAEPKKDVKKEEEPKVSEERKPSAPPSPILTTEREGGKKKSKTWIYLVAGGAAIGVAALALGGGGDGDGGGGGATGTIVISIPVD
jgi:hypothetical protein